MSASVEEVVQRLRDVGTREEARRELVALGVAAIPTLARAADRAQGSSHYPTILHTLLAVLQATINDAPDPLHFELTPAAHALIRLGLPALPTVFALMESPDEATRQRAQH